MPQPHPTWDESGNPRPSIGNSNPSGNVRLNISGSTSDWKIVNHADTVVTISYLADLIQSPFRPVIILLEHPPVVFMGRGCYAPAPDDRISTWTCFDPLVF